MNSEQTILFHKILIFSEGSVEEIFYVFVCVCVCGCGRKLLLDYLIALTFTDKHFYMSNVDGIHGQKEVSI